MSCRASVALVESRVTIGFLVMICATVVVLGSRASAATYTVVSTLHHALVSRHTHPEGEIFGGEDTTQTLFLINDQYTICPLGSTKLTSVRNAHTLRYGQSRTRPQTSYSPLLCLLVLLGLLTGCLCLSSTWLSPFSG